MDDAKLLLTGDLEFIRTGAAVCCIHIYQHFICKTLLYLCFKWQAGWCRFILLHSNFSQDVKNCVYRCYANFCSVNYMLMHKLDNSSCWSRWIWPQERGRSWSVLLQRQHRSVKDGSIACLILQQRTWIKQTWYQQYHSLHPLLTTAGYQRRLWALQSLCSLVSET